jgi:HD-like signal output (HDOD) protein
MMRLICPRCQQAYCLPEERIPVGKEIVFPCPSCKKGLIRGIKELQMDEYNNGLESKGNHEGKRAIRRKPSTSTSQLYGSELKLRLLRTVKDLPAMPQIMVKAQMIMTDPRSSLKDLAALVKTDQAIVTKALKLANSAYYGLGGKVSSIEHATVLLGSEAFGELVAMASSSKLLGAALRGYNADAGVLWRHSLAVAFGSKIIAGKRNSDLANIAFTAGIIHDAGKLILDKAVFEKRERFDDFLSNGQLTFLDAEKEILGFDHAEIASEVCKKWRIPESIAIPIKFHHSPSSSQDNELAYILHIADCIAMMSDIGTGVDDVLYRLDETARVFLGLSDADISDVMTQVFQSVENVEREMLEGSVDG